MQLGFSFEEFSLEELRSFILSDNYETNNEFANLNNSIFKNATKYEDIDRGVARINEKQAFSL